MQTMAIAETRPVICDIDATPVQEDKILITWKLPQWNSGENPTGIYIFRDTAPLENLHGLIPIAVLPLSVDSYTDAPGDFREYFYAAIVTTSKSIDTHYLINGVYYYDEQLDALPSDEKDLILPGINSTTDGTRINGIVHTSENLLEMEKSRRIASKDQKDYSGGLLREKPLPALELPDLKKQKDSSLGTAKAKLNMIMGGKNYSQKKVADIYIFPEDRNSKKATVPVRSLIQKDFEQAQIDLTAFLKSRSLSKEQINRARFYLAECLYFTGDFSSATKEFALLQDIFPKQCQSWARESLDMMSRN